MDRKIPNIKQYLLTISLLLFLMIPNILLILIGEDSAVGSLLKKGVFFLISLSIIALPLIIIKPKSYSYFVILFFPIIIFEIYHIVHFKTPSSEVIIASLILTNYNETKELLQSNLILILLSLSALIFLIWASISIKTSFSINIKQKKNILILFSTTFILLGIRNIKLSYSQNRTTSEIIRATNYAFKVQLQKNFPVGIFLKTNQVFKGLKKKKEYILKTKKFSFNAVRKDTLNESEIYVLVIGETARKHNFHIYGYHKNTSPNLDSIKNLITFKDVKSNANATSLSVPFMLTRATPEKAEIKFNEATIINAFKEVGFSTYWISNQQIGVGSIFGLYSQAADSNINVSKSLDAAGYDENILPVFDEILNDSNQKKFIIIHSVGSHFRYNYRYPGKFKHFLPTLEKGLSIENTTGYKNKKEIINSYNNSILYTDFILSRIIQKLEKKKTNSFMYYISDHGENLFDTDEKKLLHGFEIPTKFETEIPLFIWTSNRYNFKYPNKTDILKRNINRKIATTNTFNTFLDMSNIAYPKFEKQKSFANKNFDSLQQRTFFTVNKSILKLD